MLIRGASFATGNSPNCFCYLEYLGARQCTYWFTKLIFCLKYVTWVYIYRITKCSEYIDTSRNKAYFFDEIRVYFFFLLHVCVLSRVNKYYINSQNIRTMNNITCDKKALTFNIFRFILYNAQWCYKYSVERTAFVTYFYNTILAHIFMSSRSKYFCHFTKILGFARHTCIVIGM